jgi:hypothetical protein
MRLVLLLLFQLPVYDPNPGATSPQMFHKYFDNMTQWDELTAPFRWFGLGKGRVEITFPADEKHPNGWIRPPSCSVRDLTDPNYGPSPNWAVEVTKEHFIFQGFPSGHRLEWKCQGVMAKAKPPIPLTVKK